MLKKLTTKRAGFTLVEIMIVVAIIALLAAIAVPGFLRARKRSQASVDQYAIERGKKTDDPVLVADWTAYVKKDTNLYTTGKDLLAHDFGDQTVDTIPKVPQASFDVLSDVADATFWSPYAP